MWLFFLVLKDDGPWWWSSGKSARLLLQQSKFESQWNLPFFCKIAAEKNENKPKEVGFGD